jgi:hypothetical protein
MTKGCITRRGATFTTHDALQQKQNALQQNESILKAVQQICCFAICRKSEGAVGFSCERQSIRKSGSRFSEKIMLRQKNESADVSIETMRSQAIRRRSRAVAIAFQAARQRE